MLLECVYSFPGRGKEERKEGLKNTGKSGLEKAQTKQTAQTNQKTKRATDLYTASANTLKMSALELSKSISFYVSKI